MRRRPAVVSRFSMGVFLLSVVASLLGQGRLEAQNESSAPHWSGPGIQIDCTSQCHVGHHALSEGLNSTTGNLNLCLSCHNASGLASDLPFTIAERAVPGESGRSHAFDVPATNGAAGAQPPSDAQMAARLPSGNVICSTCHNQHKAEPAFGGTPRVGSVTKVTAAGGSGVLAAGGTFSGPDGVWYLVEVVQAGSETAARFCFSKDNGISWAPTGCDPPGTTTPNLIADGATPVALDFGVVATFGAGTYALGEQWRFAAAYPFLRKALVAGGSGTGDLCYECHQGWVHTTADVRTYNVGVKKGHPNGIAYPTPSVDDDFHDTPLDGNGVLQVSGDDGDVDGNASNDMRLFGGNVECLTCHAVHFVDSNTQTVDVP